MFSFLSVLTALIVASYFVMLQTINSVISSFLSLVVRGDNQTSVRQVELVMGCLTSFTPPALCPLLKTLTARLFQWSRAASCYSYCYNNMIIAQTPDL